MIKKFWYRFFGVAIAAIVIVVLFNHFSLWSYLSLDGFNRYHNQILDYEKHHILSFTISFVVSYIFLIALGIPGTILFDLIAGFIYGPFLGLILVLVSYLCGAVLNFCIVRLLFKDIFHQKFSHLRDVILKDGCRRRTALNLIGLRFIPVVPFWLLNILAAILDIPLFMFTLTTFIGIIPTSIIYVLIGHGVRGQMLNGQVLTVATFTAPSLWVPLFLLGLLILLPNIYKRCKRPKN